MDREAVLQSLRAPINESVQTSMMIALHDLCRRHRVEVFPGKKTMPACTDGGVAPAAPDDDRGYARQILNALGAEAGSESGGEDSLAEARNWTYIEPVTLTVRAER
jgi:hypothetical protein